MDLHLNKKTRAKLYLAASEALSDVEDQGIAQAYADAISFTSGGGVTLSEVFSLAEAVADLVFENSSKCEKYLQISLTELVTSVGSKQVASGALRLNGFKPFNNGDGWTNSPNGGQGSMVKISEGFFVDYLQNWAKII